MLSISTQAILLQEVSYVAKNFDHLWVATCKQLKDIFLQSDIVPSNEKHIWPGFQQECNNHKHILFYS